MARDLGDYAVERILGYRYANDDGANTTPGTSSDQQMRLEFLLQWTPTWEPANHCEGMPVLVRQYMDSQGLKLPFMVSKEAYELARSMTPAAVVTPCQETPESSPSILKTRGTSAASASASKKEVRFTSDLPTVKKMPLHDNYTGNQLVNRKRKSLFDGPVRSRSANMVQASLSHTSTTSDSNGQSAATILAEFRRQDEVNVVMKQSYPGLADSDYNAAIKFLVEKSGKQGQ